VLHILRHADAGDSGAWTGDDAERPLSKQGRKQARRLGRHLADLGQKVDAIRTSPRVRAADTARLVGKALGVRPSVDERLGGGFDFDDLRSLAGSMGAEVTDLMLVGHDPDLSDLVSQLVGAHVGLVKGSLATIELEGRDPAPGRGTLRWLLPPEAIRG
jgi:phosphohistidine phosphatase